MDEKFTVPANVDEVLATTAKTYRKELIKMPVQGLGKSLKHMTLRPGIMYSETVGELTGDVEYRPYTEDGKVDANIAITPRELRAYFGSVEFNFSPNSVYSTIWGAAQTQGDALKGVPIALQVLLYVSLQLGAKLNKYIFSAVRNAAGKTSKDLFNGFDTITAAEITASKITTALGNLVEVAKFTEDNALTLIQGICESADDSLIDPDDEMNPCKLFVPRSVFNLYNRACLNKLGAVTYNKEYKKSYVEGFENVELVPMANKQDSNYLHLTTKGNMLIGVNQAPGNQEKVEIGKYSSFALTYAATTFFGTQFESINKERLLVAKVATE